ncbi:MAG: hypothetical protein AABX55_03185, partial [Nanoarchaeota archaeon]
MGKNSAERALDPYKAVERIRDNLGIFLIDNIKGFKIKSLLKLGGGLRFKLVLERDFDTTYFPKLRSIYIDFDYVVPG